MNSLFEYYGFNKQDEKEYPVISGILKRLTPENIESELKKIQEIELPAEVKYWIQKYEQVGNEERNEFLWKWIFGGTKIFTGNRVDEKYLPELLKIKMLLFILDTFLDDIIDKDQNIKLLRTASDVILRKNLVSSEKLSDWEKNKIVFVTEIWEEINKGAKTFPKFNDFEGIFQYDVAQMLNALEYSYLVSRNIYLLNTTEAYAYFSHVMQVLTNITLELMCRPELKNQEFGQLRKAIWHAQKMSRIGNWISTWERELVEQDYTSWIFISALEQGVVTHEDLLKGNKEQISGAIKKSNIPANLLKEWEIEYNGLLLSSGRIHSIKIQDIAEAMQKVIFLHLSSCGYK